MLCKASCPIFRITWLSGVDLHSYVKIQFTIYSEAAYSAMHIRQNIVTTRSNTWKLVKHLQSYSKTFHC